MNEDDNLILYLSKSIRTIAERGFEELDERDAIIGLTKAIEVHVIQTQRPVSEKVSRIKTSGRVLPTHVLYRVYYDALKTEKDTITHAIDRALSEIRDNDEHIGFEEAYE